jgi:hypothetical protein
MADLMGLGVGLCVLHGFFDAAIRPGVGGVVGLPILCFGRATLPLTTSRLSESGLGSVVPIGAV